MRAGARTGSLAAGVVLVLVLAACGASPVGTLLGSWVERGGDDGAALDGVGSVDPLVVDAAGQDDLVEVLERFEELGGIDGSEALEALREVDMAESVLVLATYGDCKTSSRVTVDGSTLEVEIVQDEQVECDWAPPTVDVWVVDRDDVGDDPTLRDGDGP